MQDIKMKALIIPAKYMIDCIAQDPTTVYPVSIVIIDRLHGGGASWSVENQEKLLSFKNSGEIKRSSLIGIYRKDGKTHAEFTYQGAVTVPIDFMPELRHKATLFPSGAETFYEEIINSKN